MTEPDVTLTDYGLVVECAVFAFLLCRKGADDRLLRVWFAALFGALAVASLATAAAVAVSGIIGFVGLVVPHAARLLWGPDHRRLLPLSAVLGASFLILADLLARSLAPPNEIPVGIITAFIGAPFFLYLLRRQRRTMPYA